jgi:hypothetical protein
MVKRKAKCRKPKSKIIERASKVAERTEHINKGELATPAPEVKGAAASDRALELLQSQTFFHELLSAARSMGLVGETINAIVVYIVGISRLLAKPLCLFVKGGSSAGKNFLVDTVLALFPQFAAENLTSASLRSWNYLGDQLQHKIVYVAERNQQAGQVHPIRLLISENELIHWVTVKRNGQFVQEKHVTKGPIAAISTTTRDTVEVDDETRHISVRIDESPEQTTRIVRASVTEGKSLPDEELKAWHEIQTLLEKRAEIPIEFPDWFPAMSELVRNDDIRIRRYFRAFLQACRVVALIRSFRQAEEQLQKEAKIAVRFSDFAIAALIFNPVFAQSLDNANEQDVQTQQHVRRISARNDGRAVSASELVKELRISDDKAYRLLRDAVAAGTIVQANQPAQTNLKLYRPSSKCAFLPDPEELFYKLADFLPERVTFIHPLTGATVKYSR